MKTPLLKPNEVDLLLGYPLGKSRRLAKQGLIPCVILPDGSMRFDTEEIEELINESKNHKQNKYIKN